MNSQMKGITPILVILMLVILGAAGFFGYRYLSPLLATKQEAKPIATISTVATPPPTTPSDMTANWKVYSNTKYGYSFKYPNDWQIASAANETLETAKNINLQVSTTDIKGSVSVYDYDGSDLTKWSSSHFPKAVTPVKVLYGSVESVAFRNNKLVTAVVPSGKNAIVFVINNDTDIKSFSLIIATFKAGK